MLNLGLRREFRWRFIIADVTNPIIGEHFIANYQLLPTATTTSLRLIDAIKGLSVSGTVDPVPKPSVNYLSRRAVSDFSSNL